MRYVVATYKKPDGAGIRLAKHDGRVLQFSSKAGAAKYAVENVDDMDAYFTILAMVSDEVVTATLYDGTGDGSGVYDEVNKTTDVKSDDTDGLDKDENYSAFGDNGDWEKQKGEADKEIETDEEAAYNEEVETTEEKCPVSTEMITLRKDLCQDWSKIDACVKEACGKFPVTDKKITEPTKGASKVAMKVAAGEVSVDMESGVLKIADTETELPGNTFGQKLRHLRATLLDKFGIEKTSELLNQLALSRKTAGVQAAPIQVGEFIWLTKSAMVIESDPHLLTGQVTATEVFKDGSTMVTVKSGNVIGYVTDLSTISKRATMCRHASKGAGLCKTGAAIEGIEKDATCPFTIDTQVECGGFRG